VRMPQPIEETTWEEDDWHEPAPPPAPLRAEVVRYDEDESESTWSDTSRDARRPSQRLASPSRPVADLDEEADIIDVWEDSLPVPSPAAATPTPEAPQEKLPEISIDLDNL
jgi:hypothetical protein